jgi:ribosomal protein L24
VYQQFLSLEAFRKRLRNLEEIEGATKCARLLKQLQVEGVNHGVTSTVPTAQVVQTHQRASEE